MATPNIVEKLFGERKCSRCGRTTHSTDKCHAVKDIDGNDCFPPIPAPTKKRKIKDENPEAKTRKRAALEEKKWASRKKIPCKKWKEGKCVLDAKCNFSHDGPGFDPRSKLLCQFYRKGSCLLEAQCMYSHDKSIFPCAFHHSRKSQGGCKNKSCEYSHNPLTKEQEEALAEDQLKFELRSNKSVL